MTRNKIIAILTALAAVCIVSFVGVRQLAKGEQINNPTIVTPTVNSIPTPSGETSAQDVTESTQLNAVMPEISSTSSVDSFATQSTTSSSLFTTYPISSQQVTMPTVTQTTPTQSTTMPVMSTTVVSTTKSQQTSTTNKQTTTDPNIQQAAKQSDGFLGYLYNETGNYYYTDRDPWQRVFGFNAAYDFGAQFVFMFYDSARIKFVYDDKDWMVETWKGQYGGVFIGAEIGVYYKPADRSVEHYDCVSDNDALYMEMSLYRDGEKLFSREYTRYWWCTGFVPGKLKKYSDRSELNLRARITMENKKMLKAFIEGLESCQEFDFVEGESYKVSGLDVFINW